MEDASYVCLGQLQSKSREFTYTKTIIIIEHFRLFQITKNRQRRICCGAWGALKRRHPAFIHSAQQQASEKTPPSVLLPVASNSVCCVMLWPSFSILQISFRCCLPTRMMPVCVSLQVGDALSHILNDDGNRQDSSVFQSFSRPCFGAKGHFIAKQCKAYCLTIKITLHLCMGIKLNQEFLRFSRRLKINLKSLAFLHFTTLRAKRA